MLHAHELIMWLRLKIYEYLSRHVATLCNGFYALVVYILHQFNLMWNNIEMKCKFNNVLSYTQELMKTSWLMQYNRNQSIELELSWEERAMEHYFRWNHTFRCCCCLLLPFTSNIDYSLTQCLCTVSSVKQRVALSRKINGKKSHFQLLSRR